MNTINFANNYQTTSFKGKLFTEGVNLPKQKLNEVSALYEKMSKKLPDMAISEDVVPCEAGNYKKFINFHIDKGISTFFTSSEDFKKVFEKYAPRTLAQTFVKIAKKMNLEVEIFTLKNQITRAERNIKIAQAKPQTKAFQGLADNFKAKLENLNKELAKKQKEYDNIKLTEDITN